jgi:flagellar hook-length control protein FliK
MVMGKTNIEPLILLTAPEPVALAITRSNPAGPAFDDHLRQLQTASQPTEPARQTTAGDDRNKTGYSAAVEEPAGGSDESNQARPATSDDQAEHAAEPNAEQEPATSDSETAPTDGDTTGTAAQAGDDSGDASGEDDATEAAAAAAAGQVQVGQADNAAEFDAESADQTQSKQDVKNVKQAGSDARAVGGAKGQSTEPTPVVAANEQPTDAAATAGSTGGDAVPAEAQAAPAKLGAAETEGVEQHGVAPDARHRHQAAQGEPNTPANQDDGQNDGDAQSLVAGSEDSPKADADKTSSKQRIATTATTADQALPSARGATEPGVNGPNLATAGVAAVEASGEAVKRARSADDAGDGARQQGDQASVRTEGMLNSPTRFSRGGVAGHDSRIGDGQGLPKVDATRFVGRVARAFETAQQRGGTLHLRLSPPELGSLILELTVKQGVMTASLETETAAARQTLLNHLPALRERLAEQNIRIERFDVDVRQDGSGQSSMGSQQQPRETAFTDDAVRLPHTAAEVLEDAPTVVSRIDGTRINLIA